MHDMLRFWLDRGVDGFRMDVVHCIGKDPALPDDPPELVALPHVAAQRPTRDPRAAPRHPRRARRRYPGDRMSVGEVYLLDTARVASYYGDGDELHLSFNFPPLFTPWDAGRGARRSTIVEREHRPGRRLADLGAVEPRQPAPPHPLRRREARARAAAVLLLTLRGTPFLYAGEELGPRGRRSSRPTGSSTPAAATAAGRRSRGTPTPDPRLAGGRPVAAVAARRRPRATSAAEQADPASIAAPLPPAARGPARPRPRCSPAT